VERKINSAYGFQSPTDIGQFEVDESNRLKKEFYAAQDLFIHFPVECACMNPNRKPMHSFKGISIPDTDLDELEKFYSAQTTDFMEKHCRGNGAFP